MSWPEVAHKSESIFALLSPKEESLICQECVYNSRNRQCRVGWDQLHRFCYCSGKCHELRAACIAHRKQNKANTHRLKMMGCSGRQKDCLPELLAATGGKCLRFRPPAIFVLILCARHTVSKRGAFLPSSPPRAQKEKKYCGSSNGRSFYRVPDWHSSKHEVWAVSQSGGL